MKKIDLIAAIVFSIIIILKIWHLINEPLEIPKSLFLIHIIGVCFLFAAIGAIRFKNKLATLITAFAFLLGVLENIWRYQISEISFLFLCFRIIGYAFLCFVLLVWVKAVMDNRNAEL